jgi:hypothetical protein
MEKHKCDCGAEAVWCYLPGFKDTNDYSCDDCVITEDNKIGCSCNWNYGKEQDDLPADLPKGIEGVDWKWITHEGDDYISKITLDEKIWIYLDAKGRPNPCVEWDYSKEGFEIDEEE